MSGYSQWPKPGSCRCANRPDASQEFGQSTNVSRLSRCKKRSADPEADGVCPGVGGAQIAARGAERLAIIEPGPAAQNTTIAIAAGPGRTIGWRPDVTVVVAILGPRPHVADHVVKAKGVGGERADRHGLLIVRLAAAAGAIGVVLADGAAPRIGRRRPRPRRIFVFGLGE